MSKLCDYSKFDRIDSDTDEDENDDGAISSRGGNSHPQLATLPPAPAPATVDAAVAAPPPAAATAPAPTARGSTTKHPTIADRYVFSYNERKVYEWEQSLEEVTIYIDAPLGQLPRERAASHIVVNILPDELQVGLRGMDRYFIDEKTFDKVKTKESSWYLDSDEGVITIILSKCFRGQTWEGVLRGHLDAATTDGSGDASAASSLTSGKRGIRESIDPITKQDMQRTMMLERFQEENPGFDFRDATFNGEVPDPRTFMGGISYNH